jgi:hypothetical protein
MLEHAAIGDTGASPRQALARPIILNETLQFREQALDREKPERDFAAARMEARKDTSREAVCRALQRKFIFDRSAAAAEPSLEEAARLAGSLKKKIFTLTQRYCF